MKKPILYSVLLFSLLTTNNLNAKTQIDVYQNKNIQDFARYDLRMATLQSLKKAPKQQKKLFQCALKIIDHSNYVEERMKYVASISSADLVNNAQKADLFFKKDVGQLFLTAFNRTTDPNISDQERQNFDKQWKAINITTGNISALDNYNTFSTLEQQVLGKNPGADLLNKYLEKEHNECGRIRAK